MRRPKHIVLSDTLSLLSKIRDALKSYEAKVARLTAEAEVAGAAAGGSSATLEASSPLAVVKAAPITVTPKQPEQSSLPSSKRLNGAMPVIPASHQDVVVPHTPSVRCAHAAPLPTTYVDNVPATMPHQMSHVASLSHMVPAHAAEQMVPVMMQPLDIMSLPSVAVQVR